MSNNFLNQKTISENDIKWMSRFMKFVYEISSYSKDKRTKIGSLLVIWNEKDIISTGYNGFPRKVKDDIKERWERPEKYFWIAHSEFNSIMQCARTGRSSLGTTLITNGIPCDSCCKAVIQGGIKQLIVHKQWADYEKKFNWYKFIESAKRSKIMLEESNIPIYSLDKKLGVKGFLDGKEIDV